MPWLLEGGKAMPLSVPCVKKSGPATVRTVKPRPKRPTSTTTQRKRGKAVVYMKRRRLHAAKPR